MGYSHTSSVYVFIAIKYPSEPFIIIRLANFMYYLLLMGLHRTQSSYLLFETKGYHVCPIHALNHTANRLDLWSPRQLPGHPCWSRMACWVLSDGSVLKSICCSLRRLAFIYQRSFGGSQPFVTLFQRILHPFLNSARIKHACDAHI